jgi:hypothetical protein
VKHATTILVLAFCFSVSAVAQSDNAVPDLHTHEGTISSGIYTNDFFEFSVEIPTGWKVVDNARYEALNNKSREEAAKNPDLAKLGQGTEINAPLLVMAETKPWTDGKNHRMVRVLSTELRAQPGTPSAEEFLNFVADANRKFGLSENYVGKPESFSLGGRTAWKAYFNQQGSTRVWHSLNVAIVAKTHILQFILTSPDEDGLRSLETLLRTVRFRN